MIDNIQHNHSGHDHQIHDHSHAHSHDYEGFESFFSNQFSDIIQHAIVITTFVFLMMLVIEYINVQTQGLWQRKLKKNKFSQYLFAALLGAIPGCLGAYTAVALFSHKLISFGAVVTTMIATSGDEAFMMFAMIPKEAVIITVSLFVIAIISGLLADKFVKASWITSKFKENKLPIHEEEKDCKCIDKTNLISKSFSVHRILISALLIVIAALIIFGVLSLHGQLWMQITMLIAIAFSLFIVLSVPEHFLKEHLWDHIVKVHIPKIFLWTFLTLLAVGILMSFIDVETFISNNKILVMMIAVLIGIIPQSGPHLIFITLFMNGTIPISVLFANSISQDGHGMLPLLAESKRAFIAVKLFNVLVAFAVGYLLLFLGF
jgi:hypothetical protein